MAMTVVELCKLVAEMRRAQRKYFRARTQESLEDAKWIEREVDATIEEILRQPTLFT